jgi:hypothetical protein
MIGVPHRFILKYTLVRVLLHYAVVLSVLSHAMRRNDPPWGRSAGREANWASRLPSRANRRQAVKLDHPGSSTANGLTRGSRCTTRAISEATVRNKS